MSRPLRYKGHEILCLPKKASRKAADSVWICALAICRDGAHTGTLRDIVIIALDIGTARRAGIEHAKTLVDKQTTLAVRKQR